MQPEPQEIKITEPPPRLDKFEEVLEELAQHLDLNEDLRSRALDYLPHRRPRMGDRPSTCGAIIFLACIKAGAPRTVLEVASAVGVRPRLLRSRIRLIQRHMGEPKWSIKPELLLPRFCAKLDLPFSVEKKARNLLRRFRSSNPNSKCDSSILAAASLLATFPLLSRSAVQSATGISRTSLANLTSILLKSL